MAAPAYAFTISRAAELLGEDEALLWEPADDMEPQDGCLWIHGTGDQQTMAFTARGLDFLREVISDRKHGGAAPRS